MKYYYCAELNQLISESVYQQYIEQEEWYVELYNEVTEEEAEKLASIGAKITVEVN
jgi:hypothetical protein